MLLRVQSVRIEATHLRARLALASAAWSDRERRLKTAEKLAQKLMDERMAWSDPLAALIRAGVARSRGDDRKAAEMASLAIEGFEVADMKLYAAAARRRLGEIIGGNRGAELVDMSEDWMRRQQIKNPSAFANMLAPGFTEPFQNRGR